MGFSRQRYWSGLPCPPPVESSWRRDRTRVSFIAGIGRWVFFFFFFFFTTSGTWDWMQFCPWRTCSISCPLPSSTVLGYFSPFLSHSAQLPCQPFSAVCIPPVPIHEKNSISKIHALPGLLGTGLPPHPLPRPDACQATTGTEVGATSPPSPQHRMMRALWVWSFQNRTVPVTST